jgi:hypothetical protein
MKSSQNHLSGNPTNRELAIYSLNGDLALKPPIASLGEPHTTHSALPDRRQKRIGIDRLASNRSRAPRIRRALLKEPFPRQSSMLLKQFLNLVRKSGIPSAQRRQPAGARLFWQGERFI